jgi:para-aminobenzoate synthetase/4-amino-4-deoxychorismate lyase
LHPVASSDLFLYHKTTRREVYQQALSSQPELDDVLLWNERGELTETCTCNLVLEIAGIRYTPPLASGLLSGVLRAELLAQGEVVERTLFKDDLRRAAAIQVVNSVRGVRNARVKLAGV